MSVQFSAGKLKVLLRFILDSDSCPSKTSNRIKKQNKIETLRGHRQKLFLRNVYFTTMDLHNFHASYKLEILEI